MLQRRIKELEAQNRALASVLVQQLHQGSPVLVPGETISKVSTGGAGDELLVRRSAASVSVRGKLSAPLRGSHIFIHDTT
jgi:hypothetical protein